MKNGYEKIEIKYLFELATCKVCTLGLMCFVLLFRFKRLTGRNEIAISASDYKFYSPRHKFRRAASVSLSNIPDIPVSMMGLILANKVLLERCLK